ncbi:MAG: carbohydrate kinase family protein [Bacilli bacterium]
MSMGSERYSLVFGVSIYDIFGFTDKKYRPFDSNPGSVKVSFGGVCRNIAENMARMNVNTKFMSIVGNDDKGTNIISHAKKMGIDMSPTIVVEGGSTPTYLAIIDETGEMVSAVVDLKIASQITPEQIDEKSEIIANAEYMFFDADNPEIIEYIVKKFQGQSHFVLDTCSTAKAKKLKNLIPYFHTIKPNRYEAEILCGFSIESEEDIRKAGQWFIDQGVQNVFISLDADGIYYNNGQEEGILCAQDVDVVNVTGAGDAFVAGLGYGYTHDLNIRETVKIAVTLSIITISHEETIHPELAENYAFTFKDKMKWKEVIFS